MFYPVKSLKRGGRFYWCWVADSYPQQFSLITPKQLSSQNIVKICDDLLEVIKSESGQAINRFSLRLSSQLLHGLVRLYEKKVAVFTADICGLNAFVMKVTNKKWANVVTARTPDRLRPLPILALEEQEDEQNVIRDIQNSNNVVANIDDITLREPTIPEYQVMLNDGFGELQEPDTAMELLMRGPVEAGAQLSALSFLAADESTTWSRMEASAPRPPPRMEHVSDVSDFRTSVGASLLVAEDFYTANPDHPDNPDLHAINPDLHAINPDLILPQHDNRTDELQEGPAREEVTGETNRYTQEFVLEELTESPRAKRRRKIKLAIDKETKLSSHFMSARLKTTNVELRCEDSADDVITTAVPVTTYLHRPAHAGCRALSNLSHTLTRMFIRNLDIIRSKQRPCYTYMELPRTDQRKRPATDGTTTNELTTVSEVPPPITVTATELHQEVMPETNGLPTEVDLSMVPTQIIITSPPRHFENSSKRVCRSSVMSYRLSQQQAQVSIDDVDKENVPENQQTIGDARRARVVQPKGVMATDVPMEPPLTNRALLNHQDVNRGTVNRDIPIAEEQVGRVRSETPLGSLDRTKVSLGDSEKTTDSMKLLREQWGTLAIMNRVYVAVREGRRPVTVHTLLSRQPRPAPGTTRLAAATCFTSILRLKQRGCIEIVKDPATNEIADIRLGRRVVADH